MTTSPGASPSSRLGRWQPTSREPDHPLASLEGREFAGGRLRVLLGPSSRFGARYFSVLFERDGIQSEEALLIGLHNRGPLPSYNWIEVASTQERVAMPGDRVADIGSEGIERLLGFLFDMVPPGGHLMVEYDSPQRAETARALALGVPPLATPLGELLFRIGCGAHFKDWQIAEGGAEGPRKLQAYQPPNQQVAERWKGEAADLLRAFISRPARGGPAVKAGRERARRLLPSLTP